MITTLGKLPVRWLVTALFLVFLWQPAGAQTEAGESMQQAPIAPELENLKEAVLTLNRDLLILEEELLYPASSQVAIYVSMDLGQYFPWMLSSWKSTASWSPASCTPINRWMRFIAVVCSGCISVISNPVSMRLRLSLPVAVLTRITNAVRN